MRAPTQCSFSALPDGLCARAVDNSVDTVHTILKPAVKFTANSDVDRRSASNPFASEVRPYAGRVRRTESNPPNRVAVS